MTRGNGGFSLSPGIAYNYVVCSGTGPFKLMNTSFGFDAVSAAEVRATLHSQRQELIRLYKEGKASPGDVDEDGNTVMHVSLCC